VNVSGYDSIQEMALQLDTRPTTAAAARVSRVSITLGALGLATAAFVVAGAAARWRVAPREASHHITVFGLRLSYPSANFAAVVMLVLAAIGLIVLLSAAVAASKQIAAARRLDRSLARRLVRPYGRALVFDDARPQAFCAGLLRPNVYVSTATSALLDPEALAAVLEHEQHHARRRDPLRLAAGRVMAQSLFFVPGLGELIDNAASLSELSADESACRARAANRGALARAMLAFDGLSDETPAVGIDPARVDQLLGETPEWRFPLALSALGLGSILVLGAVALLAGRVASGSVTLALPILSRQPCVLVLALIPAALALCACRYCRRVHRSPNGRL
jgi:Zn-dependent protease with chaperone function